MTEYRFPKELQGLIQQAIPEDTSLFGGVPNFKTIYMPFRHAKALDPDNMLVVGMRGSGKSYWWSALQNKDHRTLVNRLFSHTRISENTKVSLGFGEKPAPMDYPGKDTLASLLKKFDARLIWKTVVLHHLAKEQQINPFETLGNWSQRIDWVQGHPEESEMVVYHADNALEEAGVYHLILFDALDRTTDDWQTMWRLVKGLLQVLLEFRSSKRIRPKAFVRPDHVEDPSVADFPDASKIFSNKVDLLWPRGELYGLLWQYLANGTGGEMFVNGCRHLTGVKWSSSLDRREVPLELRFDDGPQKPVFHAITGPWMGKDHRRGLPYSWLPNHLGDARRQVSPRSFLAALRHAALGEAKSDHPYPLHYDNIKRGVQEASKIRVAEMQEDYPWVQICFDPLSGLTVPCPFERIAEQWEKEKTLERLQQEIKSGKIKLPPAHIAMGARGVREDFENLALFHPMSDGRVNLPDVYRVGYGIGRRGGIKVVARE